LFGTIWLERYSVILVFAPGVVPPGGNARFQSHRNKAATIEKRKNIVLLQEKRYDRKTNRSKLHKTRFFSCTQKNILLPSCHLKDSRPRANDDHNDLRTAPLN